VREERVPADSAAQSGQGRDGPPGRPLEYVSFQRKAGSGVARFNSPHRACRTAKKLRGAAVAVGIYLESPPKAG
jgi:hypothetical protein